MAVLSGNSLQELRAERTQLIKADKDIEQGSRRLRGQQDLLLRLRDAGHDTGQAEHLVVLFQQSLTEWERHRVLIEQRVAHLERMLEPSGPGQS